jgi:DNA-binding XRE family transcriptional regulator
MRLQNRLRELRLRGELTQESLATAAGVTRQTIIAIEKRRLIPSVNLALRLAGALGVQLEDVFWLEPGRGSGDEG